MNPTPVRPCFAEAFPQFCQIGAFELGQFLLVDSCRDKKGVYVWAHRDGEVLVPRRVGIACGRTGIWGRHTLHNRWLAGLFKPNDQREQAVRQFTLEGLGNSAEVWAVEISDRDKATAFECAFRDLYLELLSIDLSVKTSWIKQRMNEWRRGSC